VHEQDKLKQEMGLTRFITSKWWEIMCKGRNI